MLSLMAWLLFILLLPDCLFAKVVLSDELKANKDIVVMDMKDFPPEKVALHLPCEESNMFATKCMVILLLYMYCTRR